MRTFLETFVDRLQPVETAINHAWWDAAVTGEEACYEKLDDLRNALDELYRGEETVEKLRDLRDDPLADPLEARTAELLYLEAVPRQIEPELGKAINRLSTELERRFSVHRPLFRGKPCTPNDLEHVLAHERSDRLRREAWEGLQSFGPQVAHGLLELVSLRNQAARTVGYDDYYHLMLAADEHPLDRLAAFFDRHDELTRAPYIAVKAEIDERIARRFGVSGSIEPWHYEDAFFGEVPAVFGAGLDTDYADADLIAIARRFYDGLGLETGPILERPSLYEAPNKDPHAFCSDLDREGDIRILLNLRPNTRWMSTMLHELGHGVYDAGIDRGLPWVLRRAAHTLTTEAIAMLFGRLSWNATWLERMGVVDRDRANGLREPAAREMRAQMLVFARWAQVMVGFERELYADPGQDLNALWWRLKKRFQGIDPPDRPTDAADWAAKIHVVVAPVYYHNYVLGECFASQIDRALGRDIEGFDGTYVDSREIGAWLAEYIFRPGARDPFDVLARNATGEPVDSAAFAEQFVSEPAG